MPFEGSRDREAVPPAPPRQKVYAPRDSFAPRPHLVACCLHCPPFAKKVESGRQKLNPGNRVKQRAKDILPSSRRHKPTPLHTTHTVRSSRRVRRAIHIASLPWSPPRPRLTQLGLLGISDLFFSSIVFPQFIPNRCQILTPSRVRTAAKVQQHPTVPARGAL
jgi:hypothetical protein